MFPADPNLEMDFTLESERSGVVEESVFQLLVLGDWSGDAAKASVDRRRPVEIDRDNFDNVMKGIGPRLSLSTSGGVDLAFDSLDDFHPDELYKKVPLFAELRDLRKRLRNADTFNSAAREVRNWSGNSAEQERPATPEPEEAAHTGGESLLDAILSKPDGGAPAPKPAISSDLSRLVGDLVRPHLVSVDEDEQAGMVAAVDEAAGALMNSILHDRKFQRLEAAWRGLFLLVRRTETANDLRISIMDLTKEELSADLKSTGDGTRSSYLGVLSSGAKGDPWTAVLGDYAFRPDVGDTATLIRLGKAAAAVRAPFISHIRPEVLGIMSLAETPDSSDWDLSGAGDGGRLWTAIRGMAESKFLGLVTPRFLARVPYGAATEPTEVFGFEEFSGTPEHDDLLWANGCFIVGHLLTASFREFEWEFGERFVQQVDGLPLYLHKVDGERVIEPCAEVQLSESAAGKLMGHGLMPLISFKGTDTVRIGRLQSISDPVSVLGGRWKD